MLNKKRLRKNVCFQQISSFFPRSISLADSNFPVKSFITGHNVCFAVKEKELLIVCHEFYERRRVIFDVYPVVFGVVRMIGRMPTRLKYCDGVLYSVYIQQREDIC